jgi:signal transduction histidine kinase
MTAADDWRSRAALVVVGVAGLAATIAAATITGVSVAGEGAALAGLARASMVAVPIAVGLYAWNHHPPYPVGGLLVAAGFACFLTTLAEADDELLYSIGRIAGWFVEVGLIWLILAFPSGRLRARVDRVLLGSVTAVLVVLYLPTAFIAETFPLPNTYTSCDVGCPESAFFALDSEPGFVSALVVPLREVLTVLIFLAVTARLVQRVRGATPLMRLTLDPVLVVAAGRLLVLATALIVRRLSPESPVVDVLAWVIALAVPALAGAFLVGLLQRRLYIADVLQRLGSNAQGHHTRAELRGVMSGALGDPTLQIVDWVGGPRGHWVDADGRVVQAPGPGTGQCLTEVRDGRRLVAGVIHDDALRDEVDVVQAVTSYALVVLENQRLAAQVESSLVEVRQSRMRILASGDRERRRIERDLHDGAQQRLVALGIQLELAEDLIKRDQQRGLEKLHSMGDEVARTLEEIQALARGVYPSLLGDRGLPEALRAAALRLPMTTRVEPDGVGRYPADVENAVYFCCLEAMQNALKHAGDTRVVTISLGEDEGLVFEVRDDGAGFDEDVVSPGAGLTNMQDRLAAVGGAVDIRSTPGAGTVVAGRIPLNGD